MKKINIFMSLVILLSIPSLLQAHDLQGAINSSDRTPNNVMRDKYRNPYETITFFKIESDMTVV